MRLVNGRGEDVVMSSIGQRRLVAATLATAEDHAACEALNGAPGSRGRGKLFGAARSELEDAGWIVNVRRSPRMAATALLEGLCPEPADLNLS